MSKFDQKQIIRLNDLLRALASVAKDYLRFQIHGFYPTESHSDEGTEGNAAGWIPEFDGGAPNPAFANADPGTVKEGSQALRIEIVGYIM